MAGMRITGLATGMDTDQAVKDMLKAERAKIDNIKKNKQTAVWRQELYRGISDKLSTFTNSFFNVLNPVTNFKSTSSFAKFSYETKIAGVSTNKVSITANGDVKNFSQKIASIDQLATKDTWTGDATNIKGVKSDDFDLVEFKDEFTSSNFKMSLSIDSNIKTIELTSAEVGALNSVADLTAKLNEKITAQFGADYTNVVSTVNIAGNDELKFDMKANTVKLFEYSGFSSSMDVLKIESGSSNYDYAGKKLSEIIDLTGIDLSKIKINGYSNFGISSSDTLSSMISKINGSGAGVKLTFNSMSEKFTLESTKEGSANNVTLEAGDTVNFFTNIGVTDAVGKRVSGKNALLNLNGTNIVQSSNTFTIEGVTFTLKELYSGVDGITLDVKKDSQAVFDNIVKFVDEYNKIIDDINSVLTEKKDRDYQPLTDDEKEAMTEEQVKIWEEKAKKGLLRNDSDLQGMLARMRTAIYETVDKAGISMAEIGITTSADYKAGGRLTIDDTKLKSAIENRFEDVVKLFTNQSDKTYLDSANATERYNENGVGNRLNDIFQDAIRLTRNSKNQKGFLLEKAGKLGDVTQTNNTLQKTIDDYDTRIDRFLDMLAEKEEKYYAMFSKMEAAMSKMQSQSSWIASQLGGN